MTSSSSTPGLARFDALEEHAAAAALREVCASGEWGRRVLAGRPYATTDDLLRASDAAMGDLTPADLREAMAGHPPIGRPRPGDPASAREQRGMAGASEELKAEMLELNLAYQDRFGHVFLICATGLTGEQMRDALRERIGNTPERERETVRAELGKINRIRLTRLAEQTAEHTEEHTAEQSAEKGDDHLMSTASVSTHILDTSIGRPAQGVPVSLSAREGATWTVLGAGATDGDGRCKDLPVPPEGTTHVRLRFETEAYLSAHRDDGAFFPEVTVTFAVVPGEHYHVPLLLNPFGYSVYRGS